MAVLPLVIWPLQSTAADEPRLSIRMGASTSVINADVNENDVRVAIRTWADMFSGQSGLRIQYLPEVILRPDQLLDRVREGQLDAFAMSTVEYQQLAAYADRELLFVDQSYLGGGEEYIILVHCDSGFQRLADLRHKSLIRYSGIIMSLASDWLTTLAAASNLGPPDQLFGSISSAKLPRTVLPVFFQQADACLVSRRSFETMAEMNPQLRAKLRVIATSPKLVPVVVAVHRRCTALQKERLKYAMTNLGDTAAGRQMLAIFGSRRVMATNASILNTSIELLAESAKARSRSGAARP